ncbi:MAG: TauD/TfdA family dioxygenase [Actinomycetota bacterium]|nr:TauD/TfdA family dioxygenase [Actinomycetota bacterium]
MTARIETAATGWLAPQLSADPELWRVPLPDAVRQELADYLAASDGSGSFLATGDGSGEFLAAGDGSGDFLGTGEGVGEQVGDPRLVGLPATSEFASLLLRRLSSAGPGLVLVTGLPVFDEQYAQRLYWALGRVIGQPVSQSRKGDLIGRVEDRGSDIGNPTQRGYESSAALPFHVDRTDVIGLLCVRAANNGGLSQVASAPTVHDLLLAEQPDLLAELYRPIPQDRRGEEPAGELPWCEIPVFSRTDQGVVTRYVRRFIMASQRHQAAPRLTAGQLAAMDALDEILTRPEVVLEMELQPGELQLINNFSILHARTAFEGPQHGAGRLLLRLWLTVCNSAPLPEEYRSLYGSVAAGTVRGGVWPDQPELLGSAVAAPA